MKYSYSISPFLLGLAALSLYCDATFAQQAITYTYDALGRLTFVKDPYAGNRDYDYDKAGNRLMVAVGVANDDVSEPGAPTAPTGLQSNHFADCAHRAAWNPSVSLAPGLYYSVRETKGSYQNTTATSIYVECTRGNPNSNKPRSVTACNSIGCSAEVYFSN